LTNPDNRGITEEEWALLQAGTDQVNAERMANKQPAKQPDNSTKQPAMRSNGKYPWAEYQNGEYHVVDPQVLYGLTTLKFQQRLHNRAHQEGLVVRTRNARDETGLGFQFFKDQKEALAKWEEEEYDDGYPDENPDKD
jgi:hypothetical protein